MATLNQVTTIVNQIHRTEKTLNISKLNFAKALYDASVQVNWDKTNYKSFHGMLTAEVTTVPVGTAYAYSYYYKHFVRIGFSDADIVKAIANLGWARATKCATIQNRKIKLTSFLTKYAGISWTDLAHSSRSQVVSNYRHYSFGLEEPYADKLDGILKTHGMTIDLTQRRRHGVCQAMTNLLDSL